MIDQVKSGVVDIDPNSDPINILTTQENTQLETVIVDIVEQEDDNKPNDESAVESTI